MIASIKAEFLKLFTIRSTYIILSLAFLLEILFAFYASGWRAQPADLANSGYVSSQVVSALVPLTLLAAIAAILLITHEYRYNIIMHTLTANKSRTTVFISKLFAISVFAIVFALFFGFLSPVLGALGVKLHSHVLAHQYIPVWSLFWRTVFYGWGFAMLASIIAFIIRIQVGAIVAVFLIPSTIENILGLILKQNQVYLPFSSLSVLIGERSNDIAAHLTFVQAASVTALYIVVGWLVAWYLFIKRDAN